MTEAGAIDMKRYIWEKMAHGKIPVLDKIEQEINCMRLGQLEDKEKIGESESGKGNLDRNLEDGT